MRKPLLAIVPIALVVLLGIVLLPGSSTRKAAAGPGCNNPAESALNQYCDPVPSSTGQHAVRAGQQALAALLPERLVRRIKHDPRLSNRARRSLLYLPSPGPRRSLRTATRSASVGALSETMLIVLVLLALALVAAAAAVRIRSGHRADSGSRRG